MKIELSEVEVSEAVKAWVEDQGVTVEGKHVDITYTAGRGDKGMTAEVNIQAEAPKKQTRKRKPVVSAAAKEKPAPADGGGKQAEVTQKATEEKQTPLEEVSNMTDAEVEAEAGETDEETTNVKMQEEEPVVDAASTDAPATSIFG